MAKPAKTLVTGTTAGKPSLMIGPGDDFSINLSKNTSVLHIDGIGILDANNPFSTVPEDAKPSLLLLIEKLFTSGMIVKGHVSTSMEKDKTVLEFYLNAVNLKSLAQMREYIIGLTKTRTRISGWKPKEILEEMRAKEAKGSNRRQVIDYLNEAIRAVGTEPSLSNKDFDKELHTKSRTVIKNRLVRK